MLAERAGELGVDVRRGVEVTGFDAGDTGVTVAASGDRRLRAGWLVGCDGGRSVGFVAWAAEGEPDLDAAGAALHRWAGQPA